MRILLVHNFYQQPGGEDQVFHAEAGLLSRRGHSVLCHTVHNDVIYRMGSLELAAATVWNRRAQREFKDVLMDFHPDVVHFHNTFPLLSASVLQAAVASGAGVIQTLHNFRLICPSAHFYRDGRVCEDCLGRGLALPGLFHGCYRGSRTASAGAVAFQGMHRFLRNRAAEPHIYIALTAFTREKFSQAGFPADRIVVKPNFLLSDPGTGDGQGGYGLYVGRLTEEKGIRVLLDAWCETNVSFELRVVGHGPLANEVAQRAEEHPGVRWLGRRGHDDVQRLMKGALFVVIPSLWFEGLPMTVVESFAAGTPVFASNIGSLANLIEDNVNGRLVPPGDVRSLAETISWAASRQSEVLRMRVAARREFERRFSAEDNYQALMEIYERALQQVSLLPGAT